MKTFFLTRMGMVLLGMLMTKSTASAQFERYEGRIENGGIPLRLDKPRIEPVDPRNWTEVEKTLLESLVQIRGYLPHVYGTLARHPLLYERWLGFARYILRESTLPGRDREMLICRIGWLSNGEYEWSAHTVLGVQEGLTDKELTQLAEGPESGGWSEADAALVRAVDELHADAFITGETWDALSKRFTTQQMMDLTLTVGAYNMLAQCLNSFGGQLQDSMVGFPNRNTVADKTGGRAGRVTKKGGIPLRLKTPRVAPLDESKWTGEQRALLQPIKEARGAVPNIYRTMAQHPKMFTPRLNFGRYIQRESSLPPREREILICRIAWLTSAEYEWAAHTRIGLDNGLTEADIGRLVEGANAPGWNDLDAALVRAAGQLHETAFIDDETWAILAKEFDTRQMMELVMTVGGYHMLAMALNSFGVQLDEGREGFPK